MTKTTLSFRTDPEIRDALDRLAAARRRDRSFLINEAIENYIDRLKWEEEEIRTGIADAERGEIVAHEDVVAWTRSLGTEEPLPVPGPRATAE